MPIVPTGYYYTPALRSKGAEGFFEGALGGLDRVQAQDFARERLRNMREERQFRTAGRVGGLQESLMGDPLGELMAGGVEGAPRRAGGGGRYSTARERAGGQAGPISQVDAEEAARSQHQLAALDRALREYQSAQSDYLGAGGPPPRADVGTGRPGFETEPGPTPADMALALQRDATLEDEGTRRLRQAIFDDQRGDADVLISPYVNEYREGLAGLPDDMARTPLWSSAAADGLIPSRAAYRDAMGVPEGWGQDPISSFAKSLDDESVDPRDAPPAFQAIEDAIRTTESPRDRKVLERAYGQLQRGVASEARARMSGDYEGQRAADAQIEEATNLLDPALLSAMDLARPELDERYENLPEAENEYKRRMSMHSLPISLEMTPGYEGLWNPAVDIGLASTTILNPSTLSAIGSLADDGNPMAARMLGRLGAEPISAQEAIKKGLVGDVVEYRSKLAAHLNEEQQLLKGAGVDEDEMAKAFLLGLIKIHGPDSFSVDNPDDLAVARAAVRMPPATQKTFLDQLFHTKAQGGKEELERLKAKTAGVMRKSLYRTVKGEDEVTTQQYEIESKRLDKALQRRARLAVDRSDAAFLPEKLEAIIEEQKKNEADIADMDANVRRMGRQLGYKYGAKGVVINPPGDDDDSEAKPTAKAKAKVKKPDMNLVAKRIQKDTKGLTGDELRSKVEELNQMFREMIAKDPRWDEDATKEVEGILESVLRDEKRRTKWILRGQVLNP